MNEQLQRAVDASAVDILRSVEVYMHSYAERNDLGPIQSRSIEMKVNGKPWEATIRYSFARGTVIFQDGQYRVEK
jgi:hypothetical protein